MELALGLGERVVDGSTVWCREKRLHGLAVREHVRQLRQPRKMQLLILKPEHEEQMRQPPVDRDEINTLLPPLWFACGRRVREGCGSARSSSRGRATPGLLARHEAGRRSGD